MARAHRKKNASELLIFGNPRKKRNAGGIGNHKPGCKCAFCDKARDVQKRVAKMPKQIRAVFDRNPKRKKTTHKTKRTKRASAAAGARKTKFVPQPYLGHGPRYNVRRDVNRRKHKRNPEMAGTRQAVRLFETFHGKEAKAVVEKQVSAAMRMDYTALGDLVALGLGDCPKHGNALTSHWDECNNLLFEGDGVKLASSPEGRQLYLIGGNQNLEKALASWEGIDPEKDLIDLGECGFVVYEARKKHSNFEPVEWVHEFGEGGNTVPRILYDRLKRQVFLSGGEYFIDASKELSPGIEG